MPRRRAWQSPFILQAALTQREGDVSGDGERIKKRAALEQNAHLLADRAELAFAQAGDFHAIHRDRPAGRPEQSRQVLDEHGFPAAGPAEDGQRFAVENIQVNPAKHLIAAKSLRQPADADEGSGGLGME